MGPSVESPKLIEGQPKIDNMTARLLSFAFKNIPQRRELNKMALSGKTRVFEAKRQRWKVAVKRDIQEGNSSIIVLTRDPRQLVRSRNGGIFQIILLTDSQFKYANGFIMRDETLRQMGWPLPPLEIAKYSHSSAQRSHKTSA